MPHRTNASQAWPLAYLQPECPSFEAEPALAGTGLELIRLAALAFEQGKALKAERLITLAYAEFDAEAEQVPPKPS